MASIFNPSGYIHISDTSYKRKLWSDSRTATQRDLVLIILLCRFKGKTVLYAARRCAGYSLSVCLDIKARLWTFDCDPYFTWLIMQIYITLILLPNLSEKATENDIKPRSRYESMELLDAWAFWNTFQVCDASTKISLAHAFSTSKKKRFGGVVVTDLSVSNDEIKPERYYYETKLVDYSVFSDGQWFSSPIRRWAIFPRTSALSLEAVIIMFTFHDPHGLLDTS